MTTGKTIALTGRIFVSKVMSLLFNMLSRLVITFFPKSKHLLTSHYYPPTLHLFFFLKYSMLALSCSSVSKSCLTFCDSMDATPASELFISNAVSSLGTLFSPFVSVMLLSSGGEGGDRGWDGWMASMEMSLSKLQEIVKDSKPGMLQSMGSQRVGHDLVTEQKQQCFWVQL